MDFIIGLEAKITLKGPLVTDKISMVAETVILCKPLQKFIDFIVSFSTCNFG